ncbi:hypothetical protein B0H13DRAFT_1892325 [Mycena leptocephala]|nr:hypothetical protein B0H13DRAFT_1892325 [Mycena leptocephala]
MQYTVDSEQFDGDWDLMMQRSWEMGMAVTIALTVSAARFVHQVVRSQVLNEHKTLSKSSVLFLTIGVIFSINKKVVIVPALLMLSAFVMGIMGAATFSINDVQITLSLAAAANLVLTALTGKPAHSAGRILWIRRAASHVGLDRTLRSRYDTAIGIILESGAIYCITAIFLGIASLYDSEIYSIGLSIAHQLINIIPMFTLVYVGLNNIDYSQSKEHIPQVPSNHASDARP